MNNLNDPVTMRPNCYRNVRPYGPGGWDDVSKRVYSIGASLNTGMPYWNQPLNYLGVKVFPPVNDYDVSCRTFRPWIAEEHVPILKTPPILPFFH